MIEKFKYWLAEINYNAICDRIGRNGWQDEDVQMRGNLKKYLEGKSPYGS